MKKQLFRVKQLADQTFSRSGKGEEALTEELVVADKKVECLTKSLQLLRKNLSTGAGSTQGQDPSAREKRLKKLPEYLLGLSMCEASNLDEDDSILKYILLECGKTEKYLANEIAEHELKVEHLVCTPLALINEHELPAIQRAKKHLNRLINEKESAASKYNHLEKQKDENPAKLSAAKDELEEAGCRVEAARDALAVEMFALVSKETQLAHTLLQYVKLQRAYHESALHLLSDTVPELERFINDSSVKPVFGFSLEEHLRVTSRTIAFPIELCVCILNELAMNEEGLFRIAGSTSKVKRMKLSLDAGMFSVPLSREYRDVHVVASVLKSYLRELPEPLLTSRLYESFVKAARLAEQPRLNALWEALHRLPQHNYNNLRYLVKFLSALTRNHATNKMTSSNLAIVIAPNLLWAADDAALDMQLTSTVNCVVETFIRHADWFFQDDVNFYMTFTKEDLMPDQCEYGFSPSFTQGVTQAAALAHETNGDHSITSLSRSMYEGRHSRSNSHDTSLILLDGGMKKAQSNSSLSDHSSPKEGSPKPVTRRKNKPLAPVPPNFTPDKNKRVEPAGADGVRESPTPNKTNDTEKPAKPPRPVISDTGKVITGVQTINRSTYKASKALKEETRHASRENVAEIRRQSLDFDKERPMLDDGKSKDGTLVVKNVIARSGVAERMKVSGGVRARPNVQPPPRPVAAPRVLPAETTPPSPPAADDVQLRLKPAVPERPATLRPQSFRGRATIADVEPPPVALERVHVYAGAERQHTVAVQRTHSSGAGEARLSGRSRRLSRSGGGITDAPRPRPPRPTIPAPPPPNTPPGAAATPAAAPVANDDNTPAAHESTNL